jgi:hypothetical protein
MKQKRHKAVRCVICGLSVHLVFWYATEVAISLWCTFSWDKMKDRFVTLRCLKFEFYGHLCRVKVRSQTLNLQLIQSPFNAQLFTFIKQNSAATNRVRRLQYCNSMKSMSWVKKSLYWDWRFPERYRNKDDKTGQVLQFLLLCVFIYIFFLFFHLLFFSILPILHPLLSFSFSSFLASIVAFISPFSILFPSYFIVSFFLLFTFSLSSYSSLP